jgi:hypothetical protein
VGLLAGCGSGANPDRLTKREFISNADDICRAANSAIEELGQPSTSEELTSYVAGVQDISTEALSKIARLNPPEADAEEVQNAIAKLQSALDLLNEYQRTDASGNKVASLVALQQANSAALEAQRFAEGYGFRECGKVPNTVPTSANVGS